MELKVLATDLDGTLIPLDGNSENKRDLEYIKRILDRHELALLYVTGRHLASVQNAIAQHDLPYPDWLICDVGTTLLQRRGADGMSIVQSYHDELAVITSALAIDDLASSLAGLAGIRQQEAEKQGTFKLSYYAEATQLDSIAAAIEKVLARLSAPYSIVASVDPFNGDGLIDLLPRGVSKAFALQRWSDHVRIAPEAIAFAGDSCNDLAALTAGYRTIVVANAAEEVVRQVTHAHRQADWGDRLFLARQAATSGVLEGLRFYMEEG